MSLSELVFGCVLHLLAGRDSVVCKDLGIAEETVSAIRVESTNTGIPAELIAAVIYQESGFRQAARGKAGETGLMQIKRNGAVQGEYLRLSDRQLQIIPLNIKIGTQYLAYSKKRCNGPPAYWLSMYNGNPCMSTTYSRAVLRKLAKIKALFYLPKTI